jgi:hypothetical protein
MASAVADPELERLLLEAEQAVGKVHAHGASPADGADAVRVARRVEGLLRTLTAVQCALVSEVDRRGLAADEGHRSAKALVGHAANLSPADAGRRAKAARMLRDLPHVAAGLADGSIGTSQVDRIARTHANERVREELIGIDDALSVAAALLPYEELDQHLNEWERLADEDGATQRAERDHRRRRFDLLANLDGSWRMAGGCGALQGACLRDIFDAYLQAELEHDWAEARARLGDAATPADLARTDPQRRMDALARIFDEAAGTHAERTGHAITTNLVVDQRTAERAMRRSAGDHPGTDPRAASYWDDLARTRLDPTGDETATATTTETDDGLDQPGRRCSTLDGHPIDPAEALAALLVGRLRRVVLDGRGVVIDMGRTARLFTGPRHLAVRLQRTTCYWPGCHVLVQHCQADHLLPWTQGGPTDQQNGAPACGAHNRVRNQGFTVGRDPTTGQIIVRRPDGRPLE